MKTNTHSRDRVLAWDGDKRQWKRFLRDVEPKTEKLDVDFSYGARLLSRLTGSTRKYAETIELDQIRRSTDEDKDTHEGMTTGVKHLLRSPKRAMGMDDATKKRQVQEFFEKRLQRRPGHGQMGQRSSESVLATKAEGLNVELKRMGWLISKKNSVTLERQERVFGAAEGEYEFAAIRGALMKLFPDTIISQEKQSAPDRKLGHVTDRRPNDRFKSRFRKTRHGKTGRYTAHETDAQDAAFHVALTATVSDNGLVIRFVWQKTNTMRRNILRVVL